MVWGDAGLVGKIFGVGCPYRGSGRLWCWCGRSSVCSEVFETWTPVGLKVRGLGAKCWLFG